MDYTFLPFNFVAIGPVYCDCAENKEKEKNACDVWYYGTTNDTMILYYYGIEYEFEYDVSSFIHTSLFRANEYYRITTREKEKKHTEKSV